MYLSQAYIITIRQKLYINVQNVMNESDARGEDDLDRREADVICF